MPVGSRPALRFGHRAMANVEVHSGALVGETGTRASRRHRGPVDGSVMGGKSLPVAALARVRSNHFSASRRDGNVAVYRCRATMRRARQLSEGSWSILAVVSEEGYDGVRRYDVRLRLSRFGMMRLLSAHGPQARSPVLEQPDGV